MCTRRHGDPRLPVVSFRHRPDVQASPATRYPGAHAGARSLHARREAASRLPNGPPAPPSGVVRLYQRTASPLMPALGVRCRFTPTCSHYAEAVLRTHGFPAGAWLTARRLARCGPWTKDGTADPPS